MVVGRRVGGEFGCFFDWRCVSGRVREWTRLYKHTYSSDGRVLGVKGANGRHGDGGCLPAVSGCVEGSSYALNMRIASAKHINLFLEGRR